MNPSCESNGPTADGAEAKFDTEKEVKVESCGQATLTLVEGEHEQPVVAEKNKQLTVAKITDPEVNELPINTNANPQGGESEKPCKNTLSKRARKLQNRLERVERLAKRAAVTKKKVKVESCDKACQVSLTLDDGEDEPVAAEKKKQLKMAKITNPEVRKVPINTNANPRDAESEKPGNKGLTKSARRWQNRQERAERLAKRAAKQSALEQRTQKEESAAAEPKLPISKTHEEAAPSLKEVAAEMELPMGEQQREAAPCLKEITEPAFPINEPSFKEIADTDELELPINEQQAEAVSCLNEIADIAHSALPINEHQAEAAPCLKKVGDTAEPELLFNEQQADATSCLEEVANAQTNEESKEANVLLKEPQKHDDRHEALPGEEKVYENLSPTRQTIEETFENIKQGPETKVEELEETAHGKVDSSSKAVKHLIKACHEGRAEGAKLFTLHKEDLHSYKDKVREDIDCEESMLDFEETQYDGGCEWEVQSLAPQPEKRRSKRSFNRSRSCIAQICEFCREDPNCSLCRLGIRLCSPGGCRFWTPIETQLKISSGDWTLTTEGAPCSSSLSFASCPLAAEERSNTKQQGTEDPSTNL